MTAATAFSRELTDRLEASTYPELGPDRLVSTSTPVQFQLGTGADIFTTTLIPAILAAQSEVILVTCFWARSKTLTALSNALESLALQRRTYVERGDHVQPLRIHVCFSSRSLLQKLFHTSSRQGHVYAPSSWSPTLGLPAAQLLRAGGIELHVKTLFFPPFSVMHPKFLIVDRERAFISSCNVSWEAWLEGCVEITGPAIRGLLGFFCSTWNVDLDHQLDSGLHRARGFQPPPKPSQDPIISSVHYRQRFMSTLIATAILPSPHHRNPRFRPFPWQRAPLPPPTPLNVALLHMIDSSLHTIYVQTPNLTCASVISALLDALRRGVDVTIVTGRDMMLLEQLITSGTTTRWCLRSMVRRYRSLMRESAGSRRKLQHSRADLEETTLEPDVEAQAPGVGRLHVSYFRAGHTSNSTQSQPNTEEPNHSHLKLTIIDDEYTVLGSGNMDRASWFTSQELGILFRSKTLATTISGVVSQALNGHLATVYASTN